MVQVRLRARTPLTGRESRLEDDTARHDVVYIAGCDIAAKVG